MDRRLCVRLVVVVVVAFGFYYAVEALRDVGNADEPRLHGAGVE